MIRRFSFRTRSALIANTVFTLIHLVVTALMTSTMGSSPIARVVCLSYGGLILAVLVFNGWLPTLRESIIQDEEGFFYEDYSGKRHGPMTIAEEDLGLERDLRMLKLRFGDRKATVPRTMEGYKDFCELVDQWAAAEKKKTMKR